MSQLNCLIGDIVSGFVRTEFILSQILSELGLRDTRIEFFAESPMKKKLMKIRKDFENSHIEIKYKYIELIDKLSEVNEKRNIVVHGLVLKNAQDHDDYIFHNYQKFNGETSDKTTLFKTSDLENIHREIIDIHNALYKLHFD